MGTSTIPPPRPDDKLEELKAIRRELEALRKLFDTFAGVYLASKFPCGKPSDRWSRR